MTTPASPSVAFILGAGFCVDAARAAGNPEIVLGQMTARPELHRPRYPTVNDLARLCFGLGAPPSSKSIEELFQDDMGYGPGSPLERLVHAIMEADHYLASLLRSDGSHPDNVYARFLLAHPTAPLLTFNYDALPEIILRSHGLWRPADGFGVPVHAHVGPFGSRAPDASCNSRPVLHLHGSLYVYAVVSRIVHRADAPYPLVELRDEPRFQFDPYSLSHEFRPFERLPGMHGYMYPSERILAPIPDKAEGLKGEFIQAVYRGARDALEAAQQVVVIGYSFNRHDECSYSILLDTAAGKPVLVVTPDATALTARLASEYPRIRWLPVPYGFHEWATRDYPGLR